MLLSICALLVSAIVNRTTHLMLYRLGEINMADRDACRNGTVALKLSVLYSDLYFTEDLTKCLLLVIFINYHRRPAS